MSRTKHRSRDRRLALLREAAVADLHSAVRGILCHREGGMSMHNPDLKRLVAMGMMRFERKSSYGRCLSPKRFNGAFKKDYGIATEIEWWSNNRVVERGHGLHGHANITRAVITDLGRRALESGRA